MGTKLSKLANELHCECGDDVRIRQAVSGVELTTFGVGGELLLVAEPNSISTASQLLQTLNRLGVDWRMLGAGSNILIPSSGLPDVVVRLGKGLSGWLPLEQESTAESLSILCDESGKPQMLPAAFETDTRVLAFGAAPLMGLSRKLSSVGLAGLEFAAGIPGSLGGAIKMNAGAHGHSMDEVVRKVFCLDSTGAIGELDKIDMHFGYRRSAIASNKIIVAAELQLQSRSAAEISAHRASCLEYRKRTQPLHLPSAGSVFKNPIDKTSPHCDEQRAAAELLEEAGLKGTVRGGVGFSDMHANWLCRLEDGAHADDASWLIDHAQERVMRSFGITLEPEIIRW